MKKHYLHLILFAILIGLNGCKDELFIDTQGTTYKQGGLRTLSPESMDWENLDWMPTPIGQTKIPSPWIGQGSLHYMYGSDIIEDRKASDGWTLLYNTFTSSSTSEIKNPYFILYNKYTGILRIFLFTTTEFVNSSSRLQDAISISSSHKTSMFNFLGKEIIDPGTSTSSYSQVYPSPTDGSMPLASRRWYMFQYELAYDPSILSIPKNEISLVWSLNYQDIATIDLGGKAEGKITGTIGSASSNNSNVFSSLTTTGKAIGQGVLAGIGSNILSKNAVNTPGATAGSNTLGLPNEVFSSISKGVSSALQAASGNFIGAATSLLSGIIGFGGGSSPTPVNFNLSVDMKLTGSQQNSGAFPSTPISFWIPGTSAVNNLPGYIPLYDLPLGVMNFSGIPTLEIEEEDHSWYELQYPEVEQHLLWITRKTYTFNKNIDYANYLLINPAVSSIANITIKSQDLIIGREKMDPNYNVFYWNSEHANPDHIYYKYDDFDVDTNYSVRFIIEVAPKNGAKPYYIIKSLKLNRKINLIKETFDRTYPANYNP